MLERRRLALALLPLALACAPPAAPPPDASYTVRGEIVRLPPAPGGDLLIRHEAIPDFRGMDGKVVGMDAMTMPFPLAPGVKLEGIAAGDRVEFVLELRWQDATGPVMVSRLNKLPAGTRLSFDAAQDAGATPR